MDEDDNGLVSRREFRRFLRKANRKQEIPDETLTNETLNEVFDSLDENNDKNLDFEDFKKANDLKRGRKGPGLVGPLISKILRAKCRRQCDFFCRSLGYC